MFGRKRKSTPAPDPEQLYARARQLKKTVEQPEKMRVLADAADAGHKVAAFDLAVLYETNRDLVAARQRYRQAVELGHTVAPKFLTALDEREVQLGATQHRLDALRVKAEAGDAEAMYKYAWELDTDHDIADTGFLWYERAAEAGHRFAIRHVAQQLPYRDKGNGRARAEKMLRDDAADGDPQARTVLADFLRQHDPDAAIEIFEQLGAEGDVHAARHLAALHWQHGRSADAEQWYRRALSLATDAGGGEQADELAAALGSVLLERGNGDEAEPLLRRHMDGDLHLGWLLEGRGDDDAAAELYLTLVSQDLDQVEAKAGLARICRRRGDVDDAERWTEEALASGTDMHLPTFAVPPSDEQP